LALSDVILFSLSPHGASQNPETHFHSNAETRLVEPINWSYKDVMTKFWQTLSVFAAYVLLVMAFGLTGCATTASERKSSGNSLKDLAIWAGFATNAEEPADFVKETRTGNLTYQPVGVTPAGPKKNARKLTPEELQALEAELEAARIKNESVGGQGQ
jgi:hypothetical protein